MTSQHDFPVPPPLAEGAQRWLATAPAQRQIVPPRMAATVMLLRESASGPEVFMLRRVPSMAFAPSVWVFPGGGVDPRDEGGDIPWAGPSPAQWAALTGLSEGVARATVIAAVREVFEECGVLLAGPSADTVVADVSGDDWHADREALLDRSLSFAELLTRRRLVLRSDLLALQDHWVTPEMEPKRYDTWFFAARLPERQAADDRTTEADRTEWVRPAAALEQVGAGAARMMPPTIVQLRRLGAFADIGAAMVNRPDLVAVMPEPAQAGDAMVLRATLND
ncbi:NUDIX hydrolase [Flexivirga aerilata]